MDHIEQGRAHLADGDFEGAIVAFQAPALREPGNPLNLHAHHAQHMTKSERSVHLDRQLAWNIGRASDQSPRRLKNQY